MTRVLPWVLSLATLLPVAAWAGFTDTELAVIRDGLAGRRDLALRGYATDRVPGIPGPDASENTVMVAVLYRFCPALAELMLNGDDERANNLIREAVGLMREHETVVGEFGLHWCGPVISRVYFLFGPEGTIRPNALTPEVSTELVRLFADWARTESRLVDADPDHTWYIWGSENHHAMRDATAWAAARMLSRHDLGKDYRYGDGSTPAQQLPAWRAYLKRYLRERIARGMLAEFGAEGYGARTLQTWYNYFDFGADPELRRLAEGALAVWWADWAQEQLDGVRGGGKARLYQGESSMYGHRERNRGMAWFYLGQGKENLRHDSVTCMTTTTHRLPLVIIDLALDPEGRGVYECISRRPGRHLDYDLSMSLTTPETPVYVLDPEFGGILRYTYCTPDFILGTAMLPHRPHQYWSNISMQNRWHGVIFRGGLDARIYPQCIGDKATYNQQWSVQRKGTLITQKLRTAAFSKDMRVYFAPMLTREERDGWVVARAASAYAAVRVARGRYQWDDEAWLRCDDEFTPIILEVARSADHASYEAFRERVLAQEVVLDETHLRYTSLGGDHFTFHHAGTDPPKVNGEAIDYAPPFTFRSPYLNEDWNSGVVRITKDGRELVVRTAP